MQGPGRGDIVTAGSGETRYSKCGETRYSECRESRYRNAGSRPDIVNAGSGETDIVMQGIVNAGYSECRVRGDQI
ncbi:unnamed protein product [Staurois parvus]|uniref:Uncharacterized protein n=1 Tax=Staurois parvus TaxID=386267 RepID=A0ABN9GM31_9NEOB|nr:unnamed protein product [Staurois parvus]